MMRLARGAKWGSSGFSEPGAPNNFGFKSQARATAPMPVAVRPKNWRRVTCIGSNEVSFIASFFGDRFIEVQQCAGHGGVGGKLDGVGSRIGFHLAHDEQALGVGTIRAKAGLHAAPAGYEHAEFLGARFTPGGQVEPVANARLWRRSAVMHHSLREEAGGLNVSRVVEQIERLERRGRAGTPDRAGLAKGHVEDQHRGVWNGAFPISVKA